MEELLNLIKTPEQAAQFLATMLFYAKLKQAMCAGKLPGWIQIAVEAQRNMKICYKFQALYEYMNSCTTEGEIKDNAHFALEFLVDELGSFVIDAMLSAFRCFPAGTRIVMDATDADSDDAVNDDGLDRSDSDTATLRRLRYVTRNIEDVKVGDFVLARDEHGTHIGRHRVSRLYQNETYLLYTLTVTDSNGLTSQVQTTAGWHCRRRTHVRMRGDFGCHWRSLWAARVWGH